MYGLYHEKPLELRDPRGRKVVDRRQEHGVRGNAKHGKGFKYNRGSPDSMSVGSDDGGSTDDDIFFSDIDLDSVLGQQLVMWSYKTPDTINIFTPVIGDTLSTVIGFAKSGLKFNHTVEKMMILKPGENIPLDISEFYIIKPGSSIMIMPRFEQHVTLEIKQLNMKFDMQIDLAQTVYQLKHRLQQERGLSLDRIDLLYKDRPMENHHFLFEHKIAKNSTIFVMLHVMYDTLVHVDTFWGSTYHLYIDSSMTGMNIIWTVLRRTVTKNIPDIMGLFELYLPKHTLVLYHGKTVVNWSTCLGYYKIDDGDTLKLSTIGLYHKLTLQKIPVVEETGRVHTVKVSQFDRWSTVALKMHGVIGVSVNLIRIYLGGKLVDFSETIGKYGSRSLTVTMDLALAKADPDVLYGIPLNFRLGNGITEILKVSANRSVKQVKEILEQMGVPNAAVYDMYIEDVKLASNGRIVDAVDDLHSNIDLKLRQYPVFVHTTQNIIHKMHVYAQESVAAFKKRIEMKTGLSMRDHKLLLAGEDFRSGDEQVVFDTRIAIRSSIFLRPKVRHEVMFLLFDTWMMKLRIPVKPKTNEIKQVLWKEMSIPSGCLASLGNFLLWYFTSNKTVVAPMRRNTYMKPWEISKHAFDPLSYRQVKDFLELEEESYMEPFRQLRKKGHREKFPYKPSARDEDEILQRIIAEQQLYGGRIKRRSFSYPANIFPSYNDYKEKHKKPRKLRRYRSADLYVGQQRPKMAKRYAYDQPQWYHTLQRKTKERRLVSPGTADEILYLKKPKRR